MILYNKINDLSEDKVLDSKILLKLNRKTLSLIKNIKDDSWVELFLKNTKLDLSINNIQNLMNILNSDDILPQNKTKLLSGLVDHFAVDGLMENDVAINVLKLFRPAHLF